MPVSLVRFPSIDVGFFFLIASRTSLFPSIHFVQLAELCRYCCSYSSVFAYAILSYFLASEWPILDLRDSGRVCRGHI